MLFVTKNDQKTKTQYLKSNQKTKTQYLKSNTGFWFSVHFWSQTTSTNTPYALAPCGRNEGSASLFSDLLLVPYEAHHGLKPGRPPYIDTDQSVVML